MLLGCHTWQLDHLANSAAVMCKNIASGNPAKNKYRSGPVFFIVAFNNISLGVTVTPHLWGVLCDQTSIHMFKSIMLNVYTLCAQFFGIYYSSKYGQMNSYDHCKSLRCEWCEMKWQGMNMEQQLWSLETLATIYLLSNVSWPCGLIVHGHIYSGNGWVDCDAWSNIAELVVMFVSMRAMVTVTLGFALVPVCRGATSVGHRVVVTLHMAFANIFMATFIKLAIEDIPLPTDSACCDALLLLYQSQCS